MVSAVRELKERERCVYVSACACVCVCVRACTRAEAMNSGTQFIFLVGFLRDTLEVAENSF